MQANNEIITTIGPNSLSPDIIKSLKVAGATSYRINLSHSSPSLLDEYFPIITDQYVKPSLDTQGAQLRVLGEPRSKFFDDSAVLRISSACSIKSGTADFLFSHPEFFQQVQPGDNLRVDSDGLVIKVIDVSPSDCSLTASAINKGIVLPNKAVDVIGRQIILDSLTQFDISSIQKYGSDIESLFLSFVNRLEDVQLARNLLAEAFPDAELPRIIAKIESRLGIANLEKILPYVDGILIDRGDLSREISISRIPIATDAIISLCRTSSVPCYVATNVLDSMILNRLPSRAEISDLYNLYSRGVSGIVLAAEVAIGKYPLECVHVVRHMHDLYRADKNCILALLPESGLLGELPESLANWL